MGPPTLYEAIMTQLSEFVSAFLSDRDQRAFQRDFEKLKKEHLRLAQELENGNRKVVSECQRLQREVNGLKRSKEDLERENENLERATRVFRRPQDQRTLGIIIGKNKISAVCYSKLNVSLIDHHIQRLKFCIFGRLSHIPLLCPAKVFREWH